MKLTKPWTPEILMECYCVEKRKPIRHEKPKPQTATVVSLWFYGLLACPELHCDWSLHNHAWNFSASHSFLSLTVIMVRLKKRRGKSERKKQNEKWKAEVKKKNKWIFIIRWCFQLIAKGGNTCWLALWISKLRELKNVEPWKLVESFLMLVLRWGK